MRPALPAVTVSVLLYSAAALVSFSAPQGQPSRTEQTLLWLARTYQSRSRGVGPRASTRYEDWPVTAQVLARIELDNVPVLDRASLSGELSVLAVASTGDLMQAVDKTEVIQMINPLADQPDASGTWYKMRLLDGTEGWVFAGRPERRTVTLFYNPAAVAAAMEARQRRERKEGLVILGLLGLVVGWFVLRRLAQGPRRVSTESYSSEEPERTGVAVQTAVDQGRTDWPWGKHPLVMAPRNVYEEGFLVDRQVGHIEEDFLGREVIMKDGLLSSKSVGRIETDFLGNPTAIISKSGEKIGDITTTITGRKIIVNEDGEEIGEYKRE